MTDYNGHLLPDKPLYDTEEFPYYIVQIIPRDDGTSIGWYRYSTLPFVVIDDRLINKGEVHYTSALEGASSWGITTKDDAWVLSLPADTLVWSNHEIVPGIMDCNGHYLPILPDYAYDNKKLPYATILRRDLGGVVDYFLYLSNMQMVYDTKRENPPSIINNTDVDCEWLRYSCDEYYTHWATSYYASGGVRAGTDEDFGEYGELIWCNYNMVRIDEAQEIRRSFTLAYLMAQVGPHISMKGEN